MPETSAPVDEHRKVGAAERRRAGGLDSPTEVETVRSRTRVPRSRAMRESSSPKAATSPAGAKSPGFSADESTAVVRYQVEDVDRSVDFYTRHLGFADAQ